MNNKDISVDQVKDAIKQIESIQESKDYQRLDKILPLVLEILKRMVSDDENASKGCKFYAPVWVDRLLNRLIADKDSLSSEEYDYFKREVEELSFSDYKKAADSMSGYKIQYASSKEISEAVIALKHFFQLL